jgi:hypothetical protein
MPDHTTSLLISDEEDINQRLAAERARLRREAGLSQPRHFQRPGKGHSRPKSVTASRFYSEV